MISIPLSDREVNVLLYAVNLLLVDDGIDPDDLTDAKLLCKQLERCSGVTVQIGVNNG